MMDLGYSVEEERHAKYMYEQLIVLQASRRT